MTAVALQSCALLGTWAIALAQGAALGIVVGFAVGVYLTTKETI